MKPEEKELLLKDLCARLPYWVKVKVRYFYEYQDGTFKKYDEIKYFDAEILDLLISGDRSLDDIKPYLRPMSSMTEEEKNELKQEHVKDQQLFAEVIVVLNNTEMRGKVIPHFAADWCDKNMFDYRGLIPAGRAISTEEFNPYKD